ncbi:MAG TPA: T9SS type A sorting domain-containing protein [bacterium]|nr:T9SS type A sorting domain-containing protein [bacterium]HPN44240.1 T9SS type A sorting domain-containing protein [bacterium]
MKAKLLIAVAIMFCTSMAFAAGPIIIDHTCIDIYQVPIEYINAAKTNLHIGYGFTSHGSQIVSGMSGLIGFMNTKTGYPQNLFAYNSSGSGGALHLYEGSGYDEGGNLSLDAGYYSNWVDKTRAFLGAPNASGRGSSRPEYNVIMWAWCGQLSGYSHDDLYNMYINDMNQLEQDYFGVTFVYMTGHSDGSGLEGTLHNRNTEMRNYCIANNKVLFDFYDIECYNPDGVYFGDKYVTDECNYSGGNWAIDWQNAHTEGVDWYSCEPAHTQPIVGNMKAYAIWWLWARLAGWAGPEGTDTTDNNPSIVTNFALQQNYPNPFNAGTTIQFSLPEKSWVSLTVYNLKGQVVQTPLQGTRTAGNHSITLAMNDLPSGIYYYTLQAGKVSQTRKFTLIK